MIPCFAFCENRRDVFQNIPFRIAKRHKSGCKTARFTLPNRLSCNPTFRIKVAKTAVFGLIMELSVCKICTRNLPTPYNSSSYAKVAILRCMRANVGKFNHTQEKRRFPTCIFNIPAPNDGHGFSLRQTFDTKNGTCRDAPYPIRPHRDTCRLSFALRHCQPSTGRAKRQG